ncbi:hypothetical protein [Pseudoalteromonas sp. KS88]|uniref:hypothetical protein n=1 Tax=Pseudoalteromonas sp. KS88 TaxID=2109918 RepID=UPI001436A6D3|nr:hypothetical protein [Pseudoalteromonas sp. KS88]
MDEKVSDKHSVILYTVAWVEYHQTYEQKLPPKARCIPLNRIAVNLRNSYFLSSNQQTSIKYTPNN